MSAARGRPHLRRLPEERRTRLEEQALPTPQDYVFGMAVRLRLWRGVGKQQGSQYNYSKPATPHL